MTKNTEIEVGDRFESRDYRDAGRIIEVKRDLGGGYWLAETEAHPKNPDAVGNRFRTSTRTLTGRRFKRVSR